MTASPHQLDRIHQLATDGFNSRQIAREVGLMRHEVMAILRQPKPVRPPTAMTAVIPSTPRVYVTPRPGKTPVVRGHVFTMFRG
jgi:hypothetical protein